MLLFHPLLGGELIVGRVRSFAPASARRGRFCEQGSQFKLFVFLYISRMQSTFSSDLAHHEGYLDAGQHAVTSCFKRNCITESKGSSTVHFRWILQLGFIFKCIEIQFSCGSPSVTLFIRFLTFIRLTLRFSSSGQRAFNSP